MGNWMHKIGGVAFASLLAVTLNGKAYADEAPTTGDDAASEPVIQTQTAVSAASAMEKPAQETMTEEESASSRKGSASEEESASAEPAGLGNAALSVAAADEDESDDEDNDAEIAVDNTDEDGEIGLDGMGEAGIADGSGNRLAADVDNEDGESSEAEGGESGEAEGGESDEAEGGESSESGETEGGEEENEDNPSLIGEDGLIHACYPLEEGGFILVNYSGEDQGFSRQGDIVILAAGINHIPVLSSAKGKIYVGGSGILLVDRLGGDLEFLYDTEMYPDIEGSVAVFAKKKNGSYMLVNGSVEGILDENYTIEGVTLVVPAGGTLRLQSVSTITESYEVTIDGETKTVEETRFSTDHELLKAEHTGGVITNSCTTTATLNIAENARLIFEKTAKLVFDEIDLYDGVGYPQFNVAGTLTLNGDLDKCRATLLDGARVNGSGSFTNSVINVNPGRTSPVSVNLGEGTEMYLYREMYAARGGDLGVLTATGDSTVYFGEGCTVDTIKVKKGATLTCYGLGDKLGECTHLTLKDEATGNGKIVLHGGTFAFAKGFSAVDSLFSAWETDEENNTRLYPVQIYDYTNGTSGAASFLAEVRPAVISPATAKDGVSTEDGNRIIQTAVIQTSMKKVDSREVYNYCDLYDAENGRAFIFPESELDTLELTYDYLSQYYADEMVNGFTPNGDPELRGAIFLADTWDGEQFNRVVLKYEISPESVKSVPVKNVVRIIIQQGTAILQSTVAPAFSITGTHISMTGSGVLGGAGAGSVKFGSITLHVGKSSDDPVEIDDPTEPEEEPADPEETGAYLLLWVEEADNGCYCIVASRNGETVTRFNGSVEVSVDYTPPAGWNGESIYVVFRNEDGSYTAVEARYDPIEGKLYFMTDRADVFVVVAMDYPGSAFTPDFYKSLAEREEVKALH